MTQGLPGGRQVVERVVRGTTGRASYARVGVETRVVELSPVRGNQRRPIRGSARASLEVRLVLENETASVRCAGWSVVRWWRLRLGGRASVRRGLARPISPTNTRRACKPEFKHRQNAAGLSLRFGHGIGAAAPDRRASNIVHLEKELP